jgi:methylthioribose-1-phosphate isomerase
MSLIDSLSLRYDGKKLMVLDQTQLPQKQVWLEANDPNDLVGHIRELRVRGAPLIGLSAVLCLANLMQTGVSEKEFEIHAGQLRASRPTAVNLMNNLDRLLAVSRSTFVAADILREALAIVKEDEELCLKIAKNGAALFADGDGVLTHCNTGGLATAGVGTALGVIREAWHSGKRLHVYVDETRPLLQGGRLTTWELSALKIPYTLLCDNMAAILMREGRVQQIIVGCDRIARNGDFANKVGTYGLAVLAHHHKIPFYVAGPYTTIDVACASGADIPVEERVASEVRGVKGSFGSVEWAPSAAPVFNPSFDVTPAALVTGWILDFGVFKDAKKMIDALEKGRGV